MKTPLAELENLKPTPMWAELSLFDHKGWERVRLAVAEALRNYLPNT